VHERAERMHDAPALSSPLTAALANCGVGVWWIDSDGVFSADVTLLGMLGRSVEDLERAETEAPVCFIHSEDREAAEAVFGRSSQTRVAAEQLIRVVRPDGSCRHVLCRRDLVGDEGHVAGIAIDLTSVRRAEDTRLRGRAFSTVSTLAARLAHDFNNLLFAILGNATLALGTMQLAGDHPVRESLREIERAGTRASDIVQRLSAFARPVQPRRQMLKVGALVDAAARGIRESLPPPLTLVTQLPANEPSVLVDPRLVQELVSNLVSNAVHAMVGRDGAIALEVEPVVLDAQPWMFEVGMKPGRYIEVRVRDPGAGMNATTLEHCAEPFFSTRPKGGGMGLGLCIAQGVARSHGGALRIESEVEQGTTVQVYFPQ
jgi:signal transduction histidine kinase